MKRNKVALAAVVMLLGVALAANAQVNVTLTYTADNEITAFWYKLNDTVIPLPLGQGADWWPTVDSYTAILGTGLVHEFIWEITNWEYHDPSYNPGGFLAEITPAANLIGPPYFSSSLTSSSWDVYVNYGGSLSPANFDAVSWTAASLYGANDGSTLWNEVLNGPVSGINGAAQWIWGDVNFADAGAPVGDDRVYIRANIQVHTPEPGTIVLLGSGLLSLGLLARFRRKKK